MWSREPPSRVASAPELTAQDVIVSLRWHALTWHLNHEPQATARQTEKHAHTVHVYM